MTKELRKPGPTENPIKVPRPPAKSLKEKILREALEKTKKYNKGKK